MRLGTQPMCNHPTAIPPATRGLTDGVPVVAVPHQMRQVPAPQIMAQARSRQEMRSHGRTAGTLTHGPTRAGRHRGGLRTECGRAIPSEAWVEDDGGYQPGSMPFTNADLLSHVFLMFCRMETHVLSGSPEIAARVTLHSNPVTGSANDPQHAAFSWPPTGREIDRSHVNRMAPCDVCL